MKKEEKEATKKRKAPAPKEEKKEEPHKKKRETKKKDKEEKKAKLISKLKEPSMEQFSKRRGFAFGNLGRIGSEVPKPRKNNVYDGILVEREDSIASNLSQSS